MGWSVATLAVRFVVAGFITGLAVGTASAAGLRTIEVTPEKAKAGEAAFTATCVACHGPTAEGRVGMAPNIVSKSFLAAASDQMLIETISKGRTGTTMVPWGPSLGDEKIESIIAYLRTKQPVAPAALDERPNKGDVAAGESIFANICVMCHGRHGAGYQEAVSGTGIGRKVFLDTVTDGFLRYIIKHGKSQTKMRPFDQKSPIAVANLSDEEIEDVIAYLRKQAW